eukprot:TRINITY_DN3136_c0_g1_i1.p1 TRINITY_DN3136_c0_g1~~TRINITY_DN3136_c0_g1_i1.p1  ORF type:complete len:386 (+),score=140.10 TRINITY_DN3136_c0_g1_i1:785-1942(+)
MVVEQIRSEARQQALNEIARSDENENNGEDDAGDGGDGNDGNGGDGGGDSALLVGKKGGSIIKKGEELLLRQAVNTRDAKGNTPLHWALKQNQNEIVSMLVALGADLSIANDNGELPIHCAVDTCTSFAHGTNNGSKGQHALAFHSLQILLNNEADVNSPNVVTGETPVSLASVNEDLTTLSYLVQQGADVNCQDGNGYTPLMYSVQMGNEDTLIGLMRSGAGKSVNSKDNLKGWTALHWAAATDSPLCTHALISSGANVNAVNAKGETPLMLSMRGSKKFQVPMAKYLLDNGADPTLMDVEGKTALDRIGSTSSAQQLKGLINQWLQENEGSEELQETSSLVTQTSSNEELKQETSDSQESTPKQTTKSSSKRKNSTKKQLVAG